ncbi:hypothetical protein B14911_16125 [Bacillus sp. NRRL B-14911]|nr:hypothetical protein B14911_16125 [Bacillus sp. NRRL B-14911]
MSCLTGCQIFNHFYNESYIPTKEQAESFIRYRAGYNFFTPLYIGSAIFLADEKVKVFLKK